MLVRASTLLALALAATLGIGGCAKRPPANIVLITLDTTRPDRLSIYEHVRDTTPRLAELAKRGVVCDDAWAQAPNTCPSITSTLTSRRATVTGVRGNAERLRDGIPTLATVAKDAGYRTGAFVSAAVLWDKYTDLGRGFDVYDDEMTDPCWGHDNAQRVAQKTIDRALEFVEADDGRPYFLWIHLYDPHGPYSAPTTWDDLATADAVLPPGIDLSTWHGADRIPKYLRVPGLATPLEYADAYDREIRYADHHIGRLLDALDLSDTVFALHADHGEAHGEDAYWFRHGNLLHDVALQVPMMFAGRGIAAGERLSARFRNLDVAPTLASLAGLPSIPEAEGRDLSDALEDPGGADEDPVSFIAEGRRRETVGDDTGIDTRWKLRYVDEVGIDVTWWPAADERRVRAGEAEDVYTAMEAMRAWLRDADDAGAPTLDPDGDAALRSLGYTSPSDTRTPR